MYKVVQTLSTKFGWEVKGRPMIPSILKTLGSHACERRIAYEFGNRETRKDGKTFDPIFLEKHSFSVRFVLNRIITRLQQEGMRTAISGEVRESHGVYDVVIEAGNPICTIYMGNVPRLRLEFKSSNGIELEQIQSYLVADSSPLIIVRVTMGQVVMLRPELLSDFVAASIKETVNKATRILAAATETAIMIPGRDCWDCRDLECPYVQRKYRNNGLIKLRSEAFADDLNRLFSELPKVSDVVADLVVGELRGHGEGLLG